MAISVLGRNRKPPGSALAHQRNTVFPDCPASIPWSVLHPDTAHSLRTHRYDTLNAGSPWGADHDRC